MDITPSCPNWSSYVRSDCYANQYHHVRHDVGIDCCICFSTETVAEEDIMNSVNVRAERGKIAITFPYDKNLVESVKTLPERRYRPKDHAWLVPMRLAEDVLEMFPGATVDSDITDELERQTRLSEISSNVDADFDVSLAQGELLNYQRAGVRFLDLAGGRGIIADQMGLGKTLQSLAYLQLHPELRPAVIVVPASLKINWQREIDKWMTTWKRTMVLSGTKPKSLSVCDAEIFIINYDILSKWADELIKLRPSVLIADEAHYAKNTKSARSKALKQLARKISRVILLTGTPVTNRPKELFPLLNMVAPGDWPSFFPFAERYCNAQHNGWGWDFNGASNLSELHEKIKPYVVRRTKDQVLKELPSKRRVTLPVSMTRADRKVYLSELSKARKAIIESDSLGAEHLALIEKAKQAAVRGKLRQAIEWIENFINGGDKLIVFATHKFVVNELMDAFGDAAVKITGDVSQDDRQDAVDRFQRDSDVQLFVGNIRAAGVGLTLTAASDVLFLEFAWTPGDMEQAEDRAHRIGQTDSVTAWYMVAEHTIDEDIVELLESKRVVVDTITDGSSESELRFGILSELATRIVQ